MKLNLTTSVSTEQLQAIMASVGSQQLLQGTIYQPLMQLLLAPNQDAGKALEIWELTQKLYAGKEGEVELTDAEVAILKSKLDTIVFPWLKARLLEVLK